MKASQRSAQDSFFVQYLSLMLIVVSFIVGAFSHPHYATTKAVISITAPAIEVPRDSALTDILNSRSLALLSADREQRETAQSVLTKLLLAHDLNVTIELSSSAVLQLILAQAESLRRELIQAGAPNEAIAIEINQCADKSECSKEIQTAIRLSPIESTLVNSDWSSR